MVFLALPSGVLLGSTDTAPALSQETWDRAQTYFLISVPEKTCMQAVVQKRFSARMVPSFVIPTPDEVNFQRKKSTFSSTFGCEFGSELS